MKKTFACIFALGMLIVGAMPIVASAQQLYTISTNQKNVWTPNGWAYPNSNYSYTTSPQISNTLYAPSQGMPYIYSMNSQAYESYGCPNYSPYTYLISSGWHY